MSKLQAALSLAGQGFFVFPLVEGGKLPAIDGWPSRATREPETIRRWWTDPVLEIERGNNVGIATGKWGDGGALVVLDVDVKDGRQGEASLVALQLEHGELPATRVHRSASGGWHLVYWWDVPVNHRQAGYLGDGLDVRSRGGFIVAPGSTVAAGDYMVESDRLVARAPEWLVELLGEAREAEDSGERGSVVVSVGLDDEWATGRARAIIDGMEEVSEGGRNDACFRLCCRLRDLGLDETAVGVLAEEWNWSKCAPPLDAVEVERTVESAFGSAVGAQGAARPEADFPVTTGGAAEDGGDDGGEERLHPFDELNRRHALILVGGTHSILREGHDADGAAELKLMPEQTFHRYLASHKMRVEKADGGAKHEPVTKLWMEWAGRRTYDGLCFLPGQAAPEGWYNLWRGFSVAPLSDEERVSEAAQWAVDAFYDHAWEQVCHRDPVLFDWLIGYFAHLIQRPWEKPLVALVFRGGKGVGKNALVERVGALLGQHALVADNRRYLISNFNAHMESLLMLVLDEAFWSGDKKAEGQLKGLVTGRKLLIERKGKEGYRVDNLLRVVIIGNEEWLVPASEDERRWAVFDVGDGRKQDRTFFQAMREGMEAGGYRLLLRQLLERDISGLEINQAPNTQGLTEQKIQSLGTVELWWFECLNVEAIIGSDFGDEWPVRMTTAQLYDSYLRWRKTKNIRTWPTDRQNFSKKLKSMCPGLEQKRLRESERRLWGYEFCDVEGAKNYFEAFIGGEVDWS